MVRRLFAWVILIVFVLVMVNIFTLRLFPVFSTMVYVGSILVYLLFTMRQRQQSDK